MAALRVGFSFLQRRHVHNVIPALLQRGLVADFTSKELDLRCEKPLTLYCGFDPTAGSLHVGNLLTVVTMLHFLSRGHRIIALVGGATGLIGDPSGRSTERPQLGHDVISANASSIELQLRKIFAQGLSFIEQKEAVQIQPVKFVNNADFYRDTSILDFVDTVGRHMRVTAMLAKDSIRSRLESKGGLSFAELTYQLFQAYDFYRLYEQEDCILQIGGSDQWGNITAGIDLIKKLSVKQETAFGLTLPLITDSNGEKFGKSAGNAVWLAPSLTQPFDFYQFFVRLDDKQAVKLLRFYTFIDDDQLDQIICQHEATPEKRLAQKILAEHVTRLTHGDEAAKSALQTSELMYSDQKDLLEFATPTMTITRDQLAQLTIVDIAVMAKLCSSKNEARRLVNGGGLYFNQVAVSDVNQRVKETDLTPRSLFVLRKGKKDYSVVAVL